MPYNGRYSVRPERKEEQEAADLHLFWVRPESEKVDQKLRGAAFRVLREEKATEIRPIGYLIRVWEGSDCYGSYSTCTALHDFSSI